MLEITLRFLFYSLFNILFSLFFKKEKKESIISKQILRSGTSIGANANEAVYGVSKAEFISKLQISLKETAETEYWLRLLLLTEYITEQEALSLLEDCLELKRLLVSTLNTSKANADNHKQSN